MRIYLAPMEGLLDHILRDILTRMPGIDLCVTEFIRVTDTLLPTRSFLRIAPELNHGSRTRSGVPVRVQLLGSDPVCLAENAAKLATLHPHGIDLNFGCPAKTVNRHRGGAVLLNEPALMRDILAAVRAAVPRHIPVTAKMRLGYDSPAQARDCALALQDGGAEEIVVHARTKMDGYKPPAFWEHIAALREHVSVPLIANGEIWTLEDALRCRHVSGCPDLMLGRGMVTHPALAAQIKGLEVHALDWSAIRPLLYDYWRAVQAQVAARHQGGRLKQWLVYLRNAYPEAQAAFSQVRGIAEPAAIEQALFAS